MPVWTKSLLTSVLLCGTFGCAALSGRASQGAVQDLSDQDQAAMARIGQKVQGTIVWSSSRLGNHDLFLMNADGSNKRPLTHGDHVDWFPRFAPDGKTILFCRSKKGWVAERDANRNWKWDLYTIGIDGQNEQRLVQDASWGTWLDGQHILFSRKTKVFKLDLVSKTEEVLADSEKDEALGGADLQQPQLSPDGEFLAITLRGARRETGIFNLKTRAWVATGQGCQINWHPTQPRIYWVNPSGNGNSEVFSIPVADGKPTGEFSYEQMRFVDIPGRISHEYFPQMTPDGKWMVWAATQRGHDHDIADYEIFIWEVGAPPGEIARLTFHSGNDRWPNLFVTGAGTP